MHKPFSCLFQNLIMCTAMEFRNSKNLKFSIIQDLHVIQNHAIKYNTIIYIAFIEIPPILMTFYVMANYESDTHIIIIININACCHQ